MVADSDFELEREKSVKKRSLEWHWQREYQKEKMKQRF